MKRAAAITSPPMTPRRLIVRTRMIYDQPTPSTNGAMLTVLTRLALVTGEDEYGMPRPDDPAAGLCRRIQPQLDVLRRISQRLRIFRQRVADGGAGPRTIAHPGTDPRRLGQGDAQPAAGAGGRSSEELPASHPAMGKPLENGQPTVYLCQRNACFDADHQRRRPEPGADPAAAAATAIARRALAAIDDAPSD